MVKLVRDWRDHDTYARYAGFVAQSWSMVEYLGGVDAPEHRKEAFRGYLKGVRASDRKEEEVHRHFGCGYESLLEGWREWVIARGVGIHRSPDPETRDALRDCVIPIVEDREAPLIDRVQAVRELGRAGYVLGAETLIGQLDAEGPVPQEEIVWALEAISGLALGHDEEHWRDWLYRLPAEAAHVPG